MGLCVVQDGSIAEGTVHDVQLHGEADAGWSEEEAELLLLSL